MISVVGIPFDEFSSYMRGPALAPDKIREAFRSGSSNYFTEIRLDLQRESVWKDEGNLELPAGVAAISKIENDVQEILSTSGKILSLGGDHSVTYPIIKALSKKHKKLNILHLDAHADLYHEFEGNKYSHACPFARIMEEGLVNRLVQVGIRTLTDHQREQADRFGVEIVEMKHWVPEMKFHFDDPVYVSLDMDAIDPGFAPGISHYEPGGFTPRELLSIIHKLEAEVVGADLVEYNPARDINDITAMLAAKLFKELLDLLHRSAPK